MAGLLDDVRVLDLSIWRPGPYATQLLADLGADVVKVEPPGGDPMRRFPQLFASLNSNKRSVELNLRDPDDRARGHELAAEADVLVEGFRPGVTDRLGMGEAEVRAINPDIVYCSVSGYGQDGPLRRTPGHDLNYQAYAGMVSMTGGAPVECSVPVADLAGGVFTALAACAGLLGRRGGGERVDVAMADVLATWVGPYHATAVAGREQPMPKLPGYGCFETSDGGWVTLGVIDEDHFWAPLCHAVGLADVAELDLGARLDRQDELTARLTAAVRSHTRDELVAALGDDVPVAPALSRAEMLSHAQFRQRDLVGLETGDGTPTMGYPVHFAHDPALPPGRAPRLGEHQHEGFRPRRDAPAAG